MAIGYYGVKLSGNVTETPEGYLVFKNAVIARTGFYVYKGKELLGDKVTAEELEEQDVTLDPEANVNVYRSPEEVFSKKSIDSFQTKPVTDGHPDKMIDIETVAEHELGQVFNVRAGTEPLEDGNLPLLGDIVVKSQELIDKWRAGIRELSCGYNYHIVKSGENLLQVDIIGNHVAFVENGRAGKFAKVNDSQPRMEKWTMPNFLKEIRKRGLLAWATDAKPAEVAAAFDEMAEDEDKPKTEDAEAHVSGCKCADCMGSGKDAKAADAKAKARDKFHKALDKHLDAKDAAENEQAEADDADMEALKGLFGKDTAENVEESEEHTAATDAAAEEEESEEEAESEDEDGEAEDEAVESNASPVIPVAARTKPDVPAAVDAAYRAGAEAVLKGLKPFVAKAKNKALAGAFDTTSKLVKGTGWKGSASYGKVARAAATANDSVGKDVFNSEKHAQTAEAGYAEARKKALGIK